MKDILFPILSFVLVCSGASRLQAEIKPGSIFGDHMVLQRDMKVPVWGRARSGTEVTVTFAGQTKTARAGKDGYWRVELDPMPAESKGREFTVSAGSGGIVQFTDVVVGEVWLCSGQSNMGWTVRSKGGTIKDAPAEQAAANYPLLRQFKLPKGNKPKPATDIKEAAAWTPCSPVTVGEFSGVAYFFGRDIQQKLGVPVGLINTAYGGTSIESWLSEETFSTHPAAAESRARTADVVSRWDEIIAKYKADMDEWWKTEHAAKAAGEKNKHPRPRVPVGPGHPYSAFTVYNAMLHPVVPYAIRGAIWYQGEANSRHAEEYRGLMGALIEQWRKQWNQGDFPFYYVQLPNWRGEPGTSNWAWLRDAQARALEIPNTGMAVTIDVGDEKDVHPPNKKPVGQRLALLALAGTYGKEAVKQTGPVFVNAKSVDGEMVLTFKQAEGFRLTPEATGFVVAGEDRIFKPAKATIKKGVVRVSSPEVKTPVAVRYAWENAPLASLFDGNGLPAAPFRSDSWPRDDGAAAELFAAH